MKCCCFFSFDSFLYHSSDLNFVTVASLIQYTELINGKQAKLWCFVFRAISQHLTLINKEGNSKINVKCHSKPLEKDSFSSNGMNEKRCVVSMSVRSLVHEKRKC